MSNRKRKYLWTLSRNPQMEKETYNMLLDKVDKKGFWYQ